MTIDAFAESERYQRSLLTEIARLERVNKELHGAVDQCIKKLDEYRVRLGYDLDCPECPKGICSKHQPIDGQLANLKRAAEKALAELEECFNHHTVVADDVCTCGMDEAMGILSAVASGK